MPESWATVAGWDPGKSGALVILHLDRDGLTTRVDSYRFSQCTTLDVIEALRDARPKLALLERVNSFGQGRTSAFKFGMSFGVAQASLTATDTPWELITPAKWQKRFAIPKSDTQPAHKRQLKFAAQRVFPEHAKGIVLEDADAHLLAEVARRVLMERVRR